MCFSANASFIASAVLVSAGSAAIIKYRFQKHELALALIPVIFGLHQFIEGLVWLGLNGLISSELQNAAAHVYTFIAMCLWPVYIPLAILLYEYPKRRIGLFAILALGLLISLYLFWSFSIYSQLYVNARCCNSIAYHYQLPYLYGIVDFFYVAVVVLPFLLSSNARIKWLLGPGFFITFLIALALQSGGDYPSIWCFLAAVLSVLIIYALRGQRNNNNEVMSTPK